MFTTNNIKQIEQQIKTCNEQLSKLPEGSLSCSTQETRVKWFFSCKGKTTYLPKSLRNLAKQLARKKYLQAKIKDMQLQIKALSSLQAFEKSANNVESLLSNSAYLQLLSEEFSPISKELNAWASEHYDKNNSHTENLIHKSLSGNLLRSKSEAMIDMLLFQNRIPYRYENALLLQGQLFYPDFTIRHPLTGEYYYWEHFGLIDNPNYVQSSLKKMEIYINNNLIPSKNLICTFETKDSPLSLSRIQDLISYYFLDNTHRFP